MDFIEFTYYDYFRLIGSYFPLLDSTEVSIESF